MSVTFTGSGLSLESVLQTGLTTILVRMTYDPLQANPAGANDALNPANWTLVGPGISGAAVASCGTVFGDTQSIFLFTNAPLAAGVWTVTASTAIQTVGGSAMQAPRTLQFTASLSSVPPSINPGAETDTSENILRKHFNPALKGPGWSAILAGIAFGEDYNSTQTRLAFDQLFKISASGFYLDRLAGDDGLLRPAGVGMSDALFRQYSIKTTNNQLTETALLDVLQVFYGADSLRAHCDTAAAETFALHDQDDLTVLLDESLSVTVTFTAAEFGPIGLARAAEVAASITRAFRLSGSTAYAVAATDPTTGLVRVRLYSGTFGLGSSVRVTGGKAQTVLQFPTLLPVFSGLPTWTLTYLAPSATTRFTPNGSIDLSQVRVGDYVTVYGNQFNVANRGSWVITNVSWSFPGGVLTQFFDVVNLAGVAQAGVVQTAAADLMIFRPTRASTHDVLARSVVVSSLPTEADLVLPATSQSVSRGVNSGAYPPSQPSQLITSIVRSNAGLCTVVCPSHGLTVGEHVYVDGTVPTLTPPSTTAGNLTTLTSYGVASTWSQINPPVIGRHWTAMTKLNDGRVLIAGGIRTGVATSSTLMDIFTVTSTIPQGLATQYGVTLASDVGLGTAYMMCSLVTLKSPNVAGKALIMASTNNAGAFNNTSTLYTPGSIGSPGTFAGAATMVNSLAGRGICQRSDFFVMAIGGGNDTTGSATAEAYNPTTNSWAAKAAMSVARCQPACLQLNDGTVFVCGGRSSYTRLDYTSLADLGTITNTAEVYNVGGNAWSTVGRMTYARVGHAAFLLADGRVLVVGGAGYNPTQGTTVAYLNTTEIYDPVLKSWARGPSMRAPRAFFASDVLNSLLYVAGGNTTDTSVEILDLRTMKWTLCAGVLDAPQPKTQGLFTGSLFVQQYAPNAGLTDDTKLHLLTPASDSWASGGINGLQTVASVVDANTYTFSSPIALYTATTGGTSTGLTAPKTAVSGPHIYDTKSGVAFTGTKSTTAQALNAQGQYASVTVADATQFPDSPGWLVFAYGYSNQVGPVKYLGRLSATALALDYRFVFPATVPSGTTVNLLASSGAFVPASPQTAGSFYLTASPAGRVAATKAAQSIAAAGIALVVSVTYPGDRGLGGEGLPVHGVPRLSDRVVVWGSDQVDADVATARIT